MSRFVSSQHYRVLECETETSAGFHLSDHLSRPQQPQPSHVSCCEQPHFITSPACSFTDSRNRSVGQQRCRSPSWILHKYSTGLISKEIQQTAYVKLRQVEKPVHTRKRNRLSTNTNSNTKNQLRKNGKMKST